MYKVLLFLHFLGLALGVGTSFAYMTLGIASQKLSPEDRLRFGLHAFALSRNGSIGLLPLILSGIGLVLMRGVGATFAAAGGAFHVKLTLVVIMIGLLGYMQVLIKRAKTDGGGPAMAKIPKAGQAMMLLGLSVVVLAVMAFG